ncbi:hypothetical protein HDV00_005483 [Rhizophlyctis rosea]|nr:hypothetical protein HDV00_005483 [Rhizophlyctis rosea]
MTTSDEARLAQLGYKQELVRNMSFVSVYGATLSIVSMPAAAYPLVFFSLLNGGPAAMLITWPIIGLLSFCIGGSMAEIVSAYPTSGGLYYWAAQLAGPRLAPAASYFTGYFNFMGQIGLTAAASFACAQMFAAILYVCDVISPDVTITHMKYKLIVVAANAVILILCALLNTANSKILGRIGTVSSIINVGGLILTLGMVVGMNPNRSSLSDLFVLWNNQSLFNDTYCGTISILLACFTFCGYDSAAHLAEETNDPSRAGPWALMCTQFTAFGLGWATLMAIATAMPTDIDALTALAATPASTSTIVDIFLTATGSKVATVILTIIAIVSVMFCSIMLLATLGRMMYAFSRDHAMPGSNFIHHLHPTKKIPVRAVWIAAIICILIVLPALGTLTAFTAIASIGTIGLYVSYAIPIAFRVFRGASFPKGPWHLGAFSSPLAIIAIIWIFIVAVVLNLPTFNSWSSELDAPGFDPNTFNWAPVMAGAVLVFCSGYWFLSARKWFTGPALDVATVGVKLAENVEVGNIVDSEGKMGKEAFEDVVVSGGRLNAVPVGESGAMLMPK